MARKPIPCSPDSERLFLGSVLLDAQLFSQVQLEPEDFSLEPHRHIWSCMQAMADQNISIDRVTLANELLRFDQLENVGGLSYLVSLDDGLPKVFNALSYAQIIQEKSRLRKLILLANKLQSRAMDTTELSSDIVQDALLKFQEIGIDISGQDVASGAEIIQNRPGLNAILSPERGIPTGFAGIDRLLYGLRQGRIYVVGADTTTGKSAFAVNIAHNIASTGKPVLYFTLEMGHEEIMQRILAAQARVSLEKINCQALSEMERHYLSDAAEEVSGYPIYIDESPELSILDFYRKTQQMIRDKGIKVVVVDYLQIMDWQSGRRNMPRFTKENEALSYITKHFKSFARMLKIPVILVSQLSRQRALRSAKDLRPKLRDLHGSSSIEKDCHVALLIYREEMDQPAREEFKGLAEVNVAKNRGGRQGTVRMRFYGDWTLFVEENDIQPVARAVA